jgi:hypothetical protein
MTSFRVKIEENFIHESVTYTLVKPDASEETIAVASYDEHGYAGMDAIRNVVSMLANHLNVEMFIQEPGEE